MKNRVVILGLLLLQGCASKETVAPSQSFNYSDKHIDFAGWNRTPECCTAKGTSAAVASGGTNSSQAGIYILRKGGNAIDAAIAVAFVLSVERPHSAGLGGGGFMTLHLPGKGDFFVDFREEAPGKATRDMYLDEKGEVIPDLSVRGAKSVAVPGFVPGLFEIHKKWGKLKWAELLEPAIKVAENGFKLYPSLAKYIDEEKECLLKERSTKRLLFDRFEKPLKSGTILVQKDLAKTLRMIARDGDKSFRTGAIAQKMVDYVRKRGGILSMADLKNYKVKFREPVTFRYKNYSFVSAPPPSAGGALIGEILNILDGFDDKTLLESPSNYLHLLAESMRFAYADRSLFIGDPDFSKMDYVKLLDKGYADRLRARINLAKATSSEKVKPGESLGPESTHTTHLSIIDKDENAVASTLTINDHFGSCLVPDGTGVFLNDEMDDFSAKPGAKNIYGLVGEDANSIAPGKRPASSMSPTIVFQDGEPILAVGAAGGSRITTSVLQVILNHLLVFPGDLKRSLFAPRIHHQWQPDKLYVESGIPEETIQALKGKGHDVQPPPFSPIVQAVSRDPHHGEMNAVFDPRDEGGAAAW